MASTDIRVTFVRRSVDVERSAQALLDLVMHLDDQAGRVTGEPKPGRSTNQKGGERKQTAKGHAAA